MVEIREDTDLRYPPSVISAADRARWDICEKVAGRLVELYEGEGAIDNQFVFYYTRHLYNSDIPTGSPDDELPDLSEAEELVRDPQAQAEAARAWELWDELERTKPGDDINDPDVHWAHVARVADVFDELFGNPDDMEFGPEHEGQTGPDAPIKLSEAFEHVLNTPYNSNLHPRDRMGKWAHKMGALRSFAAQHRSKLRMKLATTAAAARLHHDVERAHRKGGALHADPKYAHLRHDDEQLRARAHATEQRGREGVSGKKRAAIHVKDLGKHHAIVALATIYSEEAERKFGPFHESTKDAQAAADELEHAKTTKEVAHHAAHWAIENRHEVNHVAKVAGRLAHHIARAKGLVASEEDEGDPGAELLEYADYELELVLAD